MPYSKAFGSSQNDSVVSDFVVARDTATIENIRCQDTTSFPVSDLSKLMNSYATNSIPIASPSIEGSVTIDKTGLTDQVKASIMDAIVAESGATGYELINVQEQ